MRRGLRCRVLLALGLLGVPAARAQSTPAASLTVRGRVFDLTGKPLPNVVIMATTWSRLLHGADDGVSVGASDAEGRFVARVPASLIATAHTASALCLVLRAPGRATLVWQFPGFPPLPAELAAGNLHLAPGRTVTGSVRDGAGQPVAGARVVARDLLNRKARHQPGALAEALGLAGFLAQPFASAGRLLGGAFAEQRHAVSRAVTDATGTFVLEGVPEGAAPIHCEADGYYTSGVVSTPGDAPLAFALQRSGYVKGQLVGKDGTAQQDWVELRLEAEESDPEVTLSGRDGSFRFPIRFRIPFRLTSGDAVVGPFAVPVDAVRLVNPAVGPSTGPTFVTVAPPGVVPQSRPALRRHQVQGLPPDADIEIEQRWCAETSRYPEAQLFGSLVAPERRPLLPGGFCGVELPASSDATEFEVSAVLPPRAVAELPRRLQLFRGTSGAFAADVVFDVTRRMPGTLAGRLQLPVDAPRPRAGQLILRSADDPSARALVGTDLSFSLRVGPGAHVLECVDLLSGLVLGRTPPIRVAASGRKQLELTLDARRVVLQLVGEGGGPYAASVVRILPVETFPELVRRVLFEGADDGRVPLAEGPAQLELWMPGGALGLTFEAWRGVLPSPVSIVLEPGALQPVVATLPGPGR